MWMSLSPLNIEKIWNPFVSHRIRLLQASIHYRIDTFNVMWSPSTQTLDSTFKAHWHGQDLLKSPIFAHKNPKREHYSTFSCFLRGCFVGCGFRWLGTRSSVLVENVKNCRKRWASWKWWNFCRFNPQLLGLIVSRKSTPEGRLTAKAPESDGLEFRRWFSFSNFFQGARILTFKSV